MSYEVPAAPIEDFKPDIADEYIGSAKAWYNPKLPYHGWQHALDVVSGIETISAKLREAGIDTPENTLRVAAGWHDADYYHDHTRFGFPTKEAYSAWLFSRFIKGRPASGEQKDIVDYTIKATWEGLTRVRTPLELILRRADVENIGGPTERFVAKSILLFHEAKDLGRPVSWQQHVAGSGRFIDHLIEEHDLESAAYGLMPDDTTIDVHDEPFRVAAVRNLDVLRGMDEPR